MLKSKMTDFLELKINSYFDKLISSLNGRRNALLTELKERRQLELSRKEEHLETVQAITEVRGNLTARAPLNRLHTFEDRIVSQYDRKLKLVKSSFSPVRLNFQINPNEIERAIASLGALIEDHSFDYSTFQQPVHVVRCLECPQAIAYDKTNRHIYVTNYVNAFLSVFAITGEFIRRIQLKHPTGIYGIAIQGDSLYVTGYQTHCVLEFALSGGPRFVRKVGSKGVGRNQFDTPTQLAVGGTSGDVFVAESGNHRVHVMSSKLCHKWFIKLDTFSNPCDVKVFESNLFVLTNTNPCLHVFTLTGQKIRSFISKGPMMQVESCSFFCLDADMNILMTDTFSHQIKVFSSEGNLSYTIGQPGDEKGMLKEPRGIVVTDEKKLICVSLNKQFGLQIFS